MTQLKKRLIVLVFARDLQNDNIKKHLIKLNYGNEILFCENTRAITLIKWLIKFNSVFEHKGNLFAVQKFSIAQDLVTVLKYAGKSDSPIKQNMSSEAFLKQLLKSSK